MVKKPRTFSNWLVGALLTAFCTVGVASAQEAVPQVSFEKLEQMLKTHVFDKINQRGKSEGLTLGLNQETSFEVVATVPIDQDGQTKLAALISMGSQDGFYHTGEFRSLIDVIKRSKDYGVAEEILLAGIEHALRLLKPTWAEELEVVLESTPFKRFVGKPLLEPGDFVVRVHLESHKDKKQQQGITYAILTPAGEVKFEWFIMEFGVPH